MQCTIGAFPTVAYKLAPKFKKKHINWVSKKIWLVIEAQNIKKSIAIDPKWNVIVRNSL